MALLTAQKITQSGLVPTYVDANPAGDTLVNTGKQFFHVRNESTGSITASVVPVVTTIIDPSLGTLVKENAVLTLAASEEGFLGPFEVAAFNDTAGNITITCSSTSNIKIVALYL
jgi:hypothetical protein